MFDGLYELGEWQSEVREVAEVDFSGTIKLVRDARDAHAYRLILRSGVTAVAVLDAVNLTGEYEVFEALNAQFRFPAYFGWNWDALFDCLVDLSWLGADWYVVVIDNAERLELALDHHRLFVDTLTRASRMHRSDATGSREAPAGFVVLLLTGVDDPGVVAELRAVGIDVEERPE